MSKVTTILLVGLATLAITACGSNGGGDTSSPQAPPNTNGGGDTSSPQPPQDITQTLSSGKVVSIADGDTITVLDKDHTEHKIRLSCIDAPERGQDFGTRSKDELASMIAGETVTIEYTEKDKYGRILGYVNNGSTLSNLEQVKRGMAWVYRKYCDKCEYYDAEVYARNNMLGIWSQPNPIPPWEWRRDKEDSETKDWTYLYSDTCSIGTSPGDGTVNPPNSGDDGYNGTVNPPSNESDGYSCGSKKYCTQMYSCDEAMYYFETCNLYRLDGDNDGIPCESLCG